jgi:hypothetical protein
MATRRQCRNRIRSVGCLSFSEFRRFPISVLAAGAVRAQRGPPSSGAPFLAYVFGEAKEVGRPPGRAPACPSGRAACGFHPSRRRGNQALRLRTAKTTTRDGHGEPPSIRPAAYPGQASIHSLREHSGRTGVVVGRRKKTTATATAPATVAARKVNSNDRHPDKTKAPARLVPPLNYFLSSSAKTP